MIGPMECGVLGITLVLGLLLVARPYLTRRACSAPVGEWAEISEKAGSLSRETPERRTDWTEPTRRALRLVLTGEPGRARPELIPAAVEAVAMPLYDRAQSTESLSSVAVLCGVFGTAATFATTFLPAMFDGRRLGPDDILGRLGIVFAISAVALLASLSLQAVSRRQRAEADQLSEEVLGVLSGMSAPSEGTESERLTQVLDALHTRFEGWSSEALEAQGERFDAVVEEVRGLAGGLRDLAQEMIASNARTDGTELAAIREIGSQIEHLASSLNEGILAFSQPFLQGLPAFEAMVRCADQMAALAETVRCGDLREALERTATSCRSAAATLEAVPAKLEAAVTGVGPAVESGSARGTEAGARTVVAEARTAADAGLSRLSASVDRLDTGLAALAAKVVEMGEQQARDRADMKDVLATVGRALGELAKKPTTTVVPGTDRELRGAVEALHVSLDKLVALESRSLVSRLFRRA